MLLVLPYWVTWPWLANQRGLAEAPRDNRLCQAALQLLPWKQQPNPEPGSVSPVTLASDWPPTFLVLPWVAPPHDSRTSCSFAPQGHADPRTIAGGLFNSGL